MANSTVKVTKTDKFNMLLAIDEVAENDMLVDFIKHELELIAKKSKSGSRKPTKTQVENAEILVPQILDYLASVDNATVTDIVNGIDLPTTNQRVTAQLTKLAKDNKVVRIVEKGKAYYSVV